MQPIHRKEQQRLIDNLLERYKDEAPTEALRKKIYEELTHQKFLGKVTIPFQVILREDPRPGYTYVEVLLESKV